MADARLKAVLQELANLAGSANYMLDLVTDLREPLGVGDVVEVPSIADLTVYSDGSTTQTPNTATPSVLSLACNLHPFIPVALPVVDQTQLMSGNWPVQVAQQALMQLKDSMDTALNDYLVKTICYDTSATYHDNVAGDALTSNDFATAFAKLTNNRGTLYSNLIGFLHPFAMASVQSIAAFTPAYQAAEQGSLGIPRVGFIHGVPMYLSSSLRTQRTVATTAWAITGTTTHTMTVASGHGIVPGMKITFNTVTAGGDLATAVEVSSVTATTIVYTSTGLSNASATEAGTITVESAESLIMDRTHVYAAQQKMPQARIVPYTGKTGDELQVWSIWGRIARAGRVRTLHSPAASA